MILGIDPKNDYAFKCVFGSEHHTRVLVHLLNAVLKPPPGRRVESVVILNPIIEPVVLDDKLAILDVRARDQTGRMFNAEMQMALHSAFSERWLYYWAELHSSQLRSGDEYDRLEPTVSICFLDDLLFPQTDQCHLLFRLWDPSTHLVLSNHLSFHLFQLPRFTRSAEELSDPLDVWLYFLNNIKRLDPDDLPKRLQVPEVKEAVSVLRRLTQEEIERHRYQSREKALRDALSWQGEKERLQQQQAEVQQQQAEVQQQQAEVRQQQAEVRQQQAEVQRQQAAFQRWQADARAQGLANGLEEGHARGLAEGLIGQVRLCERFLNRSPLPEEHLRAMSVPHLEELLSQLCSELPVDPTG